MYSGFKVFIMTWERRKEWLLRAKKYNMRVKLLYFVSIQLSGNNNELVFCRIGGAESPIITPQFSLILLQFSIFVGIHIIWRYVEHIARLYCMKNSNIRWEGFLNSTEKFNTICDLSKDQVTGIPMLCHLQSTSV